VSIMIDLRASLRFARKLRTCPPERVLKDPAHAEPFRQHMQICPDCAEPSIEPTDPWRDLVDSLRRALAAGANRHETPPRAGEIRLIRPELGRWHEGFYYTPPAVLLLKTIEGSQSAFRAAQVYGDADLAGPGDLVLEPARTGTMELMIECWNSYPVMSDQLGGWLGAVSDEVLKAVSDLAEDPRRYPEWAVVPAAMGEDDPRVYFRELEVEVAHLFARDAVSAVLEAMEKHRFRIETAGGSIEQDLRRIRPGIRLGQGWRSPEEALVLAGLPPEEFALAADEKERVIAGANFVLVRDHLVRKIQPVHVELFPREWKSGRMVIGGRFLDPPRHEGELRLLIFLARGNTPLVPPHKVVFDPGTGDFSADFPDGEQGPAEVKIALLCYVDDE